MAAPKSNLTFFSLATQAKTADLIFPAVVCCKHNKEKAELQRSFVSVKVAQWPKTLPGCLCVSAF